MFRYALFDLDGTLTDPGEGITKSIQYSFEWHGIPVEDRKELEVYIGPPLRDEFMIRLKVDEEKADSLAAKFRERYNDVGWKENVLIPGVPEALKTLRRVGFRLALASSKPVTVATRVLRHFDLEQYFDAICCSAPDGSHALKKDIVARALAELQVPEEEKPLAAMVGDRKHDVIGGKANGIATVGLLTGYGSREELTAAGADFIAASPGDMVQWLLV